MNKKKLVASSLLVGMALGSVAPLVGENKNINIASAATQEVFYAEKKDVNVLTMYEIYAKGKLNKHYMESVEEKKHITEEYVETTVDETDNESYISFNEEADVELESEFNDITYDNFVEMSTPSNNSFKSYMDYTCITSYGSPQYDLQLNAYTDSSTGIRMVDGRYCVAVGSYYTTEIGTYIDLVMENGSIIPCILADQKADAHTDSATHRQNANGSIAEFVVETYAMPSLVRTSGSLSSASDELQGEISYIRVYE